MAFNLGPGIAKVMQSAVQKIPAGGLSMTNPGAPTVTPSAVMGGAVPVFANAVKQMEPAPVAAPAPAAPTGGFGRAIANTVAPIIQKAAPAMANIVAQPATPATVMGAPAPHMGGLAKVVAPIVQKAAQAAVQPVHDLSSPEGVSNFEKVVNDHIAAHPEVTPPGSKFTLGSNNRTPEQHLASVFHGATQAVQQAHQQVPMLDAAAEQAAQKAQAAAQAGNLGEAMRQHNWMMNLHNRINRVAQNHSFASGLLSHLAAIKR